jgi:hypothetical protein
VSAPPRVFLLSPARCDGGRARQLLNPRASFEMAVRLRNGGAPLADVFAFMSSLYFRGKIAYARAFANPPAGLPGAYVITSNQGLRPAEETVDLVRLRRLARGSIDAGSRSYRGPLLRDTRALLAVCGAECQVVLLGSVASPKYVDVLQQVLAEQLLFPAEFVGRGDMSRGGLMLRCVDARRELSYIPVKGAVRHGARPPRLEPRTAAS